MSQSSRMSYKLSFNKQRGFSLFAAFIVIASLMAVLAYFLAGSGINTNGVSSVTGSARASSIITQANNMKSGVDMMLASSSVSMSSLKFTDDAVVGLFNADTGGTTPQVPDITSYESRTAPDGFWIYRGASLKIKGVGTGAAHANGSYAVLTSGLSRGVCEQINQTLHGSTTVPDSGAAITAFRGNGIVKSTPIDTTTSSLDLSGLTGANAIDGWDKGCLQAGTNYVYYHILKSQ